MQPSVVYSQSTLHATSSMKQLYCHFVKRLAVQKRNANCFAVINNGVMVLNFSSSNQNSLYNSSNNNNNNFISEDNIFGTNASLTYGPQIQIHTCV